MKQFAVRQYYVVEVIVEAESAEVAKSQAGFDQYNYDVTTRFTQQEGGPEVTAADLDDEVVELPPEIKSQEQYVQEQGQHCPFCDSTDVQAQDLKMDGGQAWSECSCNTCHKHWTDQYTLIGFNPDRY